MATKHSLTAARVRELFHYSKKTGVVTRRIDAGSRGKAGDVVTTVSEGRVQVGIDGVRYLLHRVIWLYVTGKWPDHVIDHRDGDNKNNQWRNLRDVPQPVNMQNRRKPVVKRKHDLPLGVRLVTKPSPNPFAAAITVNRKQIHLGCHPTAAMAHAAYLEAKRLMHPGCTI